MPDGITLPLKLGRTSQFALPWVQRTHESDWVEVHARRFNPEFTASFIVDDSIEQRRPGIRGGTCASCNSSFVSVKRRHTSKGHIIHDPISVPTTFQIGFCHKAITGGHAECKKHLGISERCIYCPTSNRSMDKVHDINVAGFMLQYPYFFQHYIIDAAPTLGMTLAPLLLATQEYNLSLLHTGLLSDKHSHAIRLPQVKGKEITVKNAPKMWTKWGFIPNVSIHNFAIAYVTNAQYSVYPSFAYWPFSSYQNSVATYFPVRGGHHHQVKKEGPPLVVYLSRNGTISRPGIANETFITSKMHAFFMHMAMKFQVVVPSEFGVANWTRQNIVGVIGVHGGGFSNLYALGAGTKVIEITTHEDPEIRQCFASLSTGLGQNYWEYFPDLSRAKTDHHNSRFFWNRYDVPIDPFHFLDFVAEVFNGSYTSPPVIHYERLRNRLQRV